MKKAINSLIIILLSVVYAAFIVYRVWQLPLNTDMSCMLLEAKDILSGNIFLSDWSLTGVSFLTTDMPFFLIGVAVFGVSVNAYRLATALMFLFMMSGAVLLSLYGSKRKWLSFVLFSGIGLIPTYYALSNAFVHTAGFALSFYAILFATMYNDKPTKPRIILLGIVTALAICGDRITAPLFVVPLLVLCVMKILKKQVALSVITGSVAGIIIEKLYIFIGGADFNTFMLQDFIRLEKLWDSILRFIEYVLTLINANFFHKEIFSIKTPFFAIKIVTAAIAVYLIYKAVKSAVVSKKTDIPVCSLGLGFGIISLILLLTTMSNNMTSGRYIAFLPLLLGIVLARHEDKLPDKKLSIPIVAVLSIAMAATGLAPKEIPQQNVYHRLAGFLESEGLTSGYAPFWDSSVITVLSDGKVKVRAVNDKHPPLSPLIWFCNKKWYDEPGEFILVRNSGADREDKAYRLCGIHNMGLNIDREFEITIDSAEEVFGKPKEIKEFENYSILIYDNIKFER